MEWSVGPFCSDEKGYYKLKKTGILKGVLVLFVEVYNIMIETAGVCVVIVHVRTVLRGVIG